MSKISPYAFLQEFDNNGEPLAGGLLYTYDAGTATPKATYTDSDEGTANDNPVVLDAYGRADVWLTTGAYKFILKTSAGVTIKEVDDIVGEASNVFGASVTTVTTSIAVTDVYQNGVLNCTSAVTLSLLDVATANEGFLFSVKNSSSGSVVIDPDGAELIDGAATITMTAGESALIVCDGTKWISLFYEENNTGQFADDLFRIQDNADATKQIAFEGSGIDTATTRTMTIPNKDGTVATLSDITLIQGHITGLGISNDTDADHDILVATGQATDDTNTAYITLSTAITKQIDATWAVGDDAGGLDTGSVGNTTWYYLWLIKRSDTGVVDALFSTSSTSPTMPTDYDLKRLIGAVKTDGSANILAFTQKNNRYILTDSIADVNETSWDGSAGVNYALTAPPNSTALFRAVAEDGTLWGVLFTAINETNVAAGTVTTGNASLVGGSASEAAGHFEIDVNASSQIRVRTNTATMNYTRVYTYGWIFER